MEQQGTQAGAAEPAQQRRRQRRRSIPPVDVCVARFESGHGLSTRLRDLSLEGMAVVPPRFALRLGKPVWLWFGDPEVRPDPGQVIQARVVHVGAEVVGLWFQEMGIDMLEVLRELLGEAKRF